MSSFGMPEILKIAVSVGVLVLWIVGVIKLSRKGYPKLARVAIIGIIVMPVASVGYVGWFVHDRSAQA